MPFVRFICDLNERICPISVVDSAIDALLTEDEFLFREEVVLYLWISSISEQRPDEGTMVKMISQLDEFCKQHELGIRGELVAEQWQKDDALIRQHGYDITDSKKFRKLAFDEILNVVIRMACDLPDENAQKFFVRRVMELVCSEFGNVLYGSYENRKGNRREAQFARAETDEMAVIYTVIDKLVNSNISDLLVNFIVENSSFWTLYLVENYNFDEETLTDIIKSLMERINQIGVNSDIENIMNRVVQLLSESAKEFLVNTAICHIQNADKSDTVYNMVKLFCSSTVNSYFLRHICICDSQLTDSVLHEYSWDPTDLLSTIDMIIDSEEISEREIHCLSMIISILKGSHKESAVQKVLRSLPRPFTEEHAKMNPTVLKVIDALYVGLEDYFIDYICESGPWLVRYIWEYCNQKATITILQKFLSMHSVDDELLEWVIDNVSASLEDNVQVFEDMIVKCIPEQLFDTYENATIWASEHGPEITRVHSLVDKCTSTSFMRKMCNKSCYIACYLLNKVDEATKKNITKYILFESLSGSRNTELVDYVLQGTFQNLGSETQQDIADELVHRLPKQLFGDADIAEKYWKNNSRVAHVIPVLMKSCKPIYRYDVLSQSPFLLARALRENTEDEELYREVCDRISNASNYNTMIRVLVEFGTEEILSRVIEQNPKLCKIYTPQKQSIKLQPNLISQAICVLLVCLLLIYRLL